MDKADALVEEIVSVYENNGYDDETAATFGATIDTAIEFYVAK